ncbi:MAG: transporter substrate-binding domain-containing protein [Marinilabiliales bacterium]
MQFYNFHKYLSFIISVFILSCNTTESTKTPEKEFHRDLNDIIASKSITFITNNNSTDYFIYKGKPMGFQYELIQLLGKELNVNTIIKVNNDLNQSFDSLLSGKCDIIAIGLTSTNERKKIVDFTVPITQTKQVLIQRLPDGYEKMSKNDINNHLIRNLLKLGGKTVYIQKGSAFYDRLMNLSEEIGQTINIVELDSCEVEEIIRKVSEGKYDYTVCDQNVAIVNSLYYPNLDIKTEISFSQNLAWALRKDADSLEIFINNWLQKLKKTSKYKVLYNKYYLNPRAKDIFDQGYLPSSGSKLSEFDEIIKTYSKGIGWDWRLVASLIYQESRFNPNSVSWSGATGLMQLMPYTAERFGVTNLFNPEQNIIAGTKYLKYLEDNICSDIKDKNEKIKFILAAYNIGPGHVIDARALAEKYGVDNTIWTDHVDYFLLHKTNPKYYMDPVVKYGYCYGVEPYNFVIEIMDRYEHYINVIPE